jgi:hypothetical protein
MSFWLLNALKLFRVLIFSYESLQLLNKIPFETKQQIKLHDEPPQKNGRSSGGSFLRDEPLFVIQAKGGDSQIFEPLLHQSPP